MTDKTKSAHALSDADIEELYILMHPYSAPLMSTLNIGSLEFVRAQLDLMAFKFAFRAAEIAHGITNEPKPPALQPLTEYQRNNIFDNLAYHGLAGWHVDCADVIRAVEQHHGITKDGK